VSGQSEKLDKSRGLNYLTQESRRLFVLAVLELRISYQLSKFVLFSFSTILVVYYKYYETYVRHRWIFR
jgi:hypothetical protein